FLGLLAGTIQHPGNRVVRQLPRLAGPGQFPQRGVQTELEALSDTQHHRATADAMVPCNGLVTLARKRIQQQRGPYGAPFLLGSGLADRIELAQFRFSELQGIALPREGHTPLKHNRREMYWYLENGHLVATTTYCRACAKSSCVHTTAGSHASVAMYTGTRFCWAAAPAPTICQRSI